MWKDILVRFSNLTKPDCNMNKTGRLVKIKHKKRKNRIKSRKHAAIAEALATKDARRRKRMGIKQDSQASDQ